MKDDDIGFFFKEVALVEWTLNWNEWVKYFLLYIFLPNVLLKLLWVILWVGGEETCNSTKNLWENAKPQEMIHSCLGVFLHHNWRCHKHNFPSLEGPVAWEHRSFQGGKKSKPLSCQAWEITELHYHNCRDTSKICGQQTSPFCPFIMPCCWNQIKHSVMHNECKPGGRFP